MENEHEGQENIAALEAAGDMGNHGDHAIVGSPRHGKAFGIQDVIDSNIYVREGSAIQFQSPRQYIEPFLKAIGTEIGDSEVAIATGKKVSNIDPNTNEEHLSFGRVAVEYNLGTDVPEFDSVIGMVFALDLGKPMFKVYAGRNAHACTNLCIFNADDVYTHDMTTDFRSVFTKAGQYSDNIVKNAEQFAAKVDQMKDNHLLPEELQQRLGHMLLNANNNSLGVTPIVGASKFLGDQKSKYFAPNGCTEWNLYNAVTQTFTDQKHNMYEKPTKTVILSSMFGLTTSN